MKSSRLLFASILVLGTACGDDDGAVDAASLDVPAFDGAMDDATRRDAAAATDAGGVDAPGGDASMPPDAGPPTACGNAMCEVGESCAACEEDCGACPIGGAFPDNEVGPQIEANGGRCPNVPEMFPMTHVVDTQAEFTAALAAVAPGEAIVLSDGMKNWPTTIPVRAAGTAESPVYILAETLHGTELAGGKWTIEASHVVIAGFARSAAPVAYNIQAHDVRIACHRFRGSGNWVLESPRTADYEMWDRAEIDNNTFEDFRGLITVGKPRGVEDHWRDWHIHHNSMVAGRLEPSNYIFYHNGAWMPLGLEDPFIDPSGRYEARWVFENNYVEFYKAVSATTFDIKSSQNVIRNNCFWNTRPYNGRQGLANAVYGNWFGGTPPYTGHALHGSFLINAYNYFGNGAQGAAGGARGEGYRFMYGVDDRRQSSSDMWAYYSTSDGLYANNVFNNYDRFASAWLVGPSRTLPWLGDGDPNYPGLSAADLKAWPQNNFIHGIVMRSETYQGHYRAWQGGPNSSPGSSTRDYAGFVEDNPAYEEPEVVSAVLDPEVRCFTPNHVNGPGEGSLTLPDVVADHRSPYVPRSIPAPSWW